MSLQEKPNIAFSNYNGNYNYELNHMRDCAINMGLNAVICDLREMHLKNSGLYYEDLLIDIIYNKVDQLELGREDMRDVLIAVEKGLVCSVNSYASIFIGESKMSLALLTDKRFQDKYLSKSEIKFIKKHIPWTRKLEDIRTEFKNDEINLIDFTIYNKDNIVLKIDNETRGSNVYIGKFTPQVVWEGLINKAKNKNWVVQEYFPIPEVRVPVSNGNTIEFINKKFGIDMFMFGGEFAGVVSRISDKSIINVGQGGYEQPAIEVISVKEVVKND